MKNHLLPVLFLAASVSFAGVPSEINYQGRLTDANRDAVTGDVAMSLKMFDAAEAGNEIYSEDIGTVSLDDNGVYSFQFGAGGQSVVDREETIATADGASTTFSNTLGSTPLAGTLIVADGTYSWNVVDGNPGEQATATATVINGFVVGITVTHGGEGYTEAPAISIEGNGTGAAASAVVENGILTAINVDNTGSGYTNATITIAEPPAPYVVDYDAGAVSVTYETAPTAGTEILATYDANDSSIVGALSAADSHWLELSVDGTAQSPRERVLSVPFAQVAGVSNAPSSDQLKLINQLNEEIIYLQSNIQSPYSSTREIDLSPEVSSLTISMPSSLSDNPKAYNLPAPIYSREFTLDMRGITRFDLIYEDGSSASALSRINPFPTKKIRRFSYDHSGNFSTRTIQFYINEPQSVLYGLNDILPIKSDQTRLWLFAGGVLSPGDIIAARLVGPNLSYELNVNGSTIIPANFLFYDNLELSLEPGFEPSAAAQISYITVRFSY